MADFLHGIKMIEVNDGTRPIRTVATAIIGVVCTADDADSETFPLNKPILTTNPQALLCRVVDEFATRGERLKSIGNRQDPVVMVKVYCILSRF